MLWLGLAAVALGVGNIAVQMTRENTFVNALPDTVAILLFAAILIGSLMLTHASIPRQVRAMFKQNSALGEPMHVRWNTQGIYFVGGNGAADLGWKRLHRWLDDEQNFIFLQTARLMFVVPKRALSTIGIDDLSATVSGSGLARR